MDVIIFGGQSNMQGVTEGMPNDNKPIDGALEYKFLQDGLSPLVHPVGETIEDLLSVAENGGSLIPAFCRAYVKESKKDKSVCDIIELLKANTLC